MFAAPRRDDSRDVGKRDEIKRWIFDGRKVNVQHGPTTPMRATTPTAWTHGLCSRDRPRYVVTSDVRSYFFEFRAPVWLQRWLGMSAVNGTMLQEEGLRGVEVTKPSSYGPPHSGHG